MILLTGVRLLENGVMPTVTRQMKNIKSVLLLSLLATLTTQPAQAFSPTYEQPCSPDTHILREASTTWQKVVICSEESGRTAKYLVLVSRFERESISRRKCPFQDLCKASICRVSCRVAQRTHPLYVG